MHAEDPRDWAERHFGDAELRHTGRVKRSVKVAQALAEQPGMSIPNLFERWYDVKATYTLFKHADVTPDRLQSGHRKLTQRLLRLPGTYLLIGDTTDFAFTGRDVEGLGPIGKKARPGLGFLVHSTLAVAWRGSPSNAHRPPVEVIGLADQQYFVRPLSPHVGRHERQYSLGELESEFFEHANARIGHAPRSPKVRWVRVCDRGADIYEFLSDCAARGFGFVVRAKHNRNLVPEGHLFTQVRTATCLGTFEFYLRERPKHPARTAHLSLSATPVLLASPQRPGHRAGQCQPVACTAVRVWEPRPPEGVEPLEWVLLTDAEIEGLFPALTISLQYATRWVIEEYHKALKTGMRVERLQLEDGDRLQAATALMSVVALRLLDLREQLRLHPAAPADQSGLEPLEIDLLETKLERKLQTVRDVALAIGRLGGHLNRKNDGMPGWQTLYEGMKALTLMAAGARLYARLQRSG